MNQDYNGFSIHCGGTVYKYHEYKWIDWDKRTHRITRRKRKQTKKKKIENL